jgi:hypothetical protein
VEVAREFDLLIIQDDAYGYMEPNAPPSYAVLAPERTFYTRGLSKSYAPATCTGFLIAPERFAARIQNAVKNTSTGTALVNNIAALSLVADGTVDVVIARRAHEGEEDDVADGAGAGEDHGEAVDADAFAGGGGKAVAEGADVVLVDIGHGFVVAALARSSSWASKRRRWSSGSLSSEKALPTSKPPM